MPQAAAETVVRFNRWARFEHLAVITVFVLLLATGLPQKWPYAEVSRWLIDQLGGIYATRLLHRWVGALFSLLLAGHLLRVVAGVTLRRYAPSMLITWRDFQDAYHNLRYYLGYRETPPPFGRFDYRQKFEYWGMVFGSLVMVASGFILLFPLHFARWLPAEVIPASKVMHSNEALLALLIVIVWHMYDAHLNPNVFPYDSSIFTGKMSKERLRHEHAREYEERFGGPGEGPGDGEH